MMDKSSPSTSLLEQQSKTLLIFMVVVCYLVTFAFAAGQDTKYSIPQFIVGIAFGIVFLILGMFDTEVLGLFPDKARNAIYFTAQCLLVFGIGQVLGPGGNWLIGLPLAVMAVDRLSPRWRWAVYFGVLLAIVLPIAYYSTWGTALMNGAIISTAIFFVVLFSQLRLNEQDARIRAEELAHQLETANHKLAEYALQAEELAATQERNRLAREIHDNLGHYLTVVSVQIEAAKLTFDSEPSRALDSLNKAQELVRNGLTSVRESVAALRISPVENRPLNDAIAELIEETRASGFTTEFKIVGEVKPIESKSALAFYRVVQEGLTNIRKHSNASHVEVDLDFSQPDKIRLKILDDGIGAAETGGGFGLIGLRERVHLLDGEFEIKTQPGRGFGLEVTLPVAEGSAS